MSTPKEPVCEACGQVVDDAEAMVVVRVSTREQILRHWRCHMLDLLERA